MAFDCAISRLRAPWKLVGLATSCRSGRSEPGAMRGSPCQTSQSSFSASVSGMPKVGYVARMVQSALASLTGPATRTVRGQVQARWCEAFPLGRAG